MRALLITTLCFVSQSLLADVVVPNRTLRAGDIITLDVLRVNSETVEGSFDNPADVAGQEARTALYANRPIKFGQIGPPALIERNQIVQLRFSGRRLVINTEGRSLERGGIGDRVRVMNLSSRTTLFGQVQADGHVAVYD